MYYVSPGVRMGRVRYNPAGLLALFVAPVVVLDPCQALEQHREALGYARHVGRVDRRFDDVEMRACRREGAKGSHGTARLYDPGNSTRCNSGQLLASISYSTSAMTAPSSTFSIKLVNSALRQRRNRRGLAARRDFRNQRARRLHGELEPEHAWALDRARPSSS
ncbi:hypothetical protein K525DRAFT_271634 [Schizophyllum commune Loenen D]|nr:hypothetical protein K525DRAFT_271634 [Schizophyllum commune Loenen D]